MTDKELKELKDNLWHSADVLRAGAHLAANKYGQPILGLIFLRYADILFKQHKEGIEAEYEKHKGSRIEKSIKEISIEKCGFFLPECAYYDYINNAPDDANKAVLVKEAMEAIEDANPKMIGVLPKEVYAQLVPEEEPELLSNIVRIFKDIPEDCTIDIFGEIYEYFLGNFALSEGKDGGAFYTPATVVRYMVEVLNPEPGDKKFLDPACGSGGMFVQAARYMHNHNANEDEQMKFRCYGVEKEPDTVKLAKMNLLLNNVRGEITEANSFYSDPYDAFGQFDYVMANPPFNVDEVVVDKVIEDQRFNTFGVPRNKTKSKKKQSDKKETVPNANYLWIGYFATALNEAGKAGLVMANSASDASGSEYEIRKKMIEEGIISQMVLLPSNMFTSVTLPATLWFFDKEKPNRSNKDEILFVDARNVYTQIDRAHRKFSDEQIKNLGIITSLYHGEKDKFNALINEYQEQINTAPETSEDEEVKTKEYWQAQIDWLYERFPEGEYQDVIGLCKVAKLEGEDGIIDQEYSLNVGRYVGVSFDNLKMSNEEFVYKNNALIDEFNEAAASVESVHKLLIEKMEEVLYDPSCESLEGWHIGRVAELGEFKRGKNITAKEMEDGDIPVISAGMGPSGYHNAANVVGPSITISSSGANSGIVLFHLEDIWAADCSYNNDSKYIFYLYDVLHFIQPIITNLQRGSAQPHVYPKDVNRIKIVIPPENVLNNINDLLKTYHLQLDFLKKQVQNTEREIDLALIKLLSDKMDVK